MSYCEISGMTIVLIFIMKLFEMSQPMQLNLVCGYPGSGKTTFSGYLSQGTGYPHIETDQVVYDVRAAFNGERSATLINNPNSIQNSLKQAGLSYREDFGDPLYNELEFRWFRVEAILRSIEGAQTFGGAILDGTFLNRRIRETIANPILSKIMGGLDMRAYWMDTPIETCYERVKTKGGEWEGYKETLEFFAIDAHDMEIPSAEENFSRIYIVKGDIGAYQLQYPLR